VSAVLSYFEIFRGRSAAIGDDLELDLLAFIERTQTRALDRRNMHEDIFLAGGRLDEAVAFGGLKPFDGALLPRLSPSRSRCGIDAKWQPHGCTCTFAPQARFWGKVRNDRVAKTAPGG
jgi:hypothetical protein